MGVVATLKMRNWEHALDTPGSGQRTTVFGREWRARGNSNHLPIDSHVARDLCFIA